MSTVLGLTAGASEHGSADILLKEALRAASAAGCDVELVRLDDLDLRVGPSASGAPDDAGWFWDRLLEADALIVSTPIYSRTVPGALRLLGDKISGPHADVAFTGELLRMRAAGEDIAVDFTVDERVLRPRVAGFIAVGGSLPGRWKTFALPLLHTLTASMQIAVVDQVVFAGAGGPSSIVLDDAALARAASLGRSVAEQAGAAYDDASYAGEPGVCPLCHLDVVVLRADGIECATCGAAGSLVVEGGEVRAVFPEAGRAQSVLTLAEKLDHFAEVQETAARQRPLAATIRERAVAYDASGAYAPRLRPPR